jgi:putative N6-adenine-specific DNA methylase
MCGSGTLAIEAALIAARRAPGLDRSFACERWPGSDPERLAALRGRLRSGERKPPSAIWASDRNAGALRVAQKNAAAAGMAEAIHFERRDAGDPHLPTVPGGPGLCIVNPPYGLRLAGDTGAAWRALALLGARLSGWELAVLAPDRGLERILPWRPFATLRIRNGGLACRLLRYHL